MPITDSLGSPIQTDPDGFLLNGTQWTPDVAELIALEVGIGPLTDKHWRVIALCREESARRGRPCSPSRLTKLTGLDREELERLFPGGPEFTIARIAGLPRPRHTAEAGAGQQETS